jgi:hypothetical protein
MATESAPIEDNIVPLKHYQIIELDGVKFYADPDTNRLIKKVPEESPPQEDT